MRKFGWFFVALILAAPSTSIMSTRSEVTLSGFKTMRVYWGTDQPVEVASGDVETLTVVLRYELGYSFTNFKGDLSLPAGFQAVGGGNTLSTLYTGPVSLGSIVSLSFPIFITPDVEEGSYKADLRLEYIYVTAPAKEELEIAFDVTGKPHIDVRVLNDTFYEGKQRISIAFSNDGDAIAKNLEVVGIDSSSASAELEKTGFGDLNPEDSVTVPLTLFVPTGMENKLLRLDVEVSCLGPTNVAYLFSETLQLLIEPLSESIISCQFPWKSAAPGDTVQFEVRLKNPFEVGTRFKISVDSVPPGWTASVKTTSGEHLRETTLGSNEFVDFLIEVESPDSAKIGEEHELLIEAESYDGSTVGFLPLTVTMNGETKIELHSSISSLVASPGDKLLLPFVVSNVGEESETVEFSMSNRGGWSTRVLDQVGHEITKVELSSGTSLDLELEVTIPQTSAGDNNLTIATVGKANSKLSFVVEVQPLSESIISCQFPGKSAAPGDTVQFQVKLKNPFGVETQFRLSVDSIPPNWTAFVKTASGEYLTEVTLDSNEFVDLVVEVESPDSAKIGEEHELLTKAESYDGNAAGSLPLTIATRKAKEETKITAKFPEVTVEAGKVVQFPITIANLGYVDKLLLLSVKPPAGWEAVFKSGVLEVARLYMEAGESEDLIIEVTPPSTVNVGVFTIPVQVKAETGAVYAEMELKATIAGSYALSLGPSTLLTSVTTGGSTTFTAKITNTGYTSVTGVGLDIEAPGGWESSITPTQVDSLKPKESYTFSVVLKTTEDTVAGDYLVTLTGLSDQVKSDAVQVRITAAAPTSWGLIGVGIAVVMVIALLFVFMKFRRR